MLFFGRGVVCCKCDGCNYNPGSRCHHFNQNGGLNLLDDGFYPLPTNNGKTRKPPTGLKNGGQGLPGIMHLYVFWCVRGVKVVEYLWCL